MWANGHPCKIWRGILEEREKGKEEKGRERGNKQIQGGKGERAKEKESMIMIPILERDPDHSV